MRFVSSEPRGKREGNVETSKRFFFLFFFLPRLAPKSSNCGLVNANDEKFRTGQSQVSGHDSLPSSLYIRNVLQQLFAFRFTVCDSALSLPKLPPKRESDSSYSKDIYFFLNFTSFLSSFPFDPLLFNCLARRIILGWQLSNCGFFLESKTIFSWN